MTNFYSILGVGESATKEQIKKAYRDQAKQWHPDKNPNNKSAEEKFKAIQNAYETLSDSSRRLAYDKLLQDERLRQEQMKQQRSHSNKNNSWAVALGLLILVGILIAMFSEEGGSRSV
jgi:DnaJ-class molecular chaperone